MRLPAIQIITLLLFTTFSYAQDNQEILTRVGNKIVTREEFQIRYELTPQMFRENRKIKEELKLEFLYSIIAEKLLALYADEINVDTSSIVKKTLATYEEIFVRDALYKKVVRDKAIEKADSLLSFYLTSAYDVRMIFIQFDSEDEINNIYGLLKTGVLFDTLYPELKIGEGVTLTVSVGDLDEYNESQIFHLPDGAFSVPIEMNDGWYIFKIIGRYNPIIAKTAGWETDFKRMQRLAKEKAEHDFYKEFKAKFFSSKEVKINAKLLRSIAVQFFTNLVIRYSAELQNQNIILPVSDIPVIEYALGTDTLEMPFVEFGKKILTVKDFLHFFRFENFQVDTLEYKNVFTRLSNKAKLFVEYKMLEDEGYRLGLQNDPEMKKQFQMWKENYYMQLVTNMFIDSANVSDEEIIEYYNVKRNGRIGIKEVNILKIVTDSLEIVETVLDKISAGSDFEELVSLYTKDKIASSKNGETVFFPVTAKGEIGRIASNLEIGEIYGPIKVEEGFSIIKLVGIREDSTFVLKDFSEIKNELGRELAYLKKQKSYNKFIATLANKYKVIINSNKLENIQVTSHQSIVYYYPGFGSKILAVPLLNIDMEWVPEWLDSPDNIQ